MIHNLQNLNDGTFLINESVKVKYHDDFTVDLSFDEKSITEQEALELAEELLQEVLKHIQEKTDVE